MTLTVLVPPAPLLTLEEAKTHLEVEHDLHDLMIDTLIAAAGEHIQADLGRAVALTVVEERLDEFCSTLDLSLRPAIAIAGTYSDALPLGVFYVDEDGEEQPVGAGVYGLLFQEVYLRTGESWPSPISANPGAVIVRYSAGYETVPAPLKAAALLIVGNLYANREAVVTGTIATQLPLGVDALLRPYRVYFG